MTIDSEFDDRVIEILFLHPDTLTEQEWLEIDRLSKVHFIRGENNLMKCVIMAYIDWLDLDEIKRRAH